MAHPNTGTDTPGTFNPGRTASRNPTTPGDLPVKLAWEEDERNRRESQHRLDQQLKAAWERAEATIDELDKAARSEAAVLIATAERKAGLLGERAQREVSLLERERGGIVAHLDEIRNWIDTVVGDDAAG